MDFVDEENVAFLYIGEDACEVTSFFDLWARGGVKLGTSCARDDIGEGGFSEPRRAREQHVLQHIVALLRRFCHEHQTVFDLLLTVERLEVRRT